MLCDILFSTVSFSHNLSKLIFFQMLFNCKALIILFSGINPLMKICGNKNSEINHQLTAK